jgi:hypothetical protein
METLYTVASPGHDIEHLTRGIGEKSKWRKKGESWQ